MMRRNPDAAIGSTVGPMMKGSAHAFAARTMGQAGMTEDIPSPRFVSMRLLYPNDYFE